MIYVCDAIMGTGKSSAAITYMNEHVGEKFIYITPYLEEAVRIKEGCPKLHFTEPSDKIEQYHFRKSEHTAALIKHGRNIATTHQAFKHYTDEMLDDIKRFGYRLIIDENVDVLERYDFSVGDMELLVSGGYIEEENGTYVATGKEYRGSAFAPLFRFLGQRQLIGLDAVESDSVKQLFYWVLPPNLITAFKDVIILTYLFEGQSLHHFMEMYRLPYKHLGIQKLATGAYCFCAYPGYVPGYVGRLKDMLHIIDNSRLNAIGDDKFALSMSWFERNTDGVTKLKNNIFTCINRVWKGVPPARKLCGAFNKHTGKIKGKGYTNSFLSFNARATNAYRDREYLVYAVNIYMNASEKLFYRNHGIEIDEDVYALSIMVQWIWRSAIRDGDEIYIYIPSRRMRTLLINWVNSLSEGGESS